MSENDKSELQMIAEIIINTVATKKIILFGSFACGTPTEESDFDIYVLLPDDGERPLLAMQKINLALARMDIRSVDILASQEKQFYDKCKALTLERSISEKGVVLYERNEQLCQTMA